MLHSAVALRRSQDSTFNRQILRDAAAAEHGTIRARQTLRQLSVSLGREVRNFRGTTSGDYADFANALEADYGEAAALYREFQAVNPLDPTLVDLDGYMREVRRALASVLKDARSAVDNEIGAHRQFQDFAARATARTQKITRAAARPRARGAAPKSLDLDGAAKGKREPMPGQPRAPRARRGQTPDSPPSSIGGAQTAFRQRMAGAFRTPSVAEGLDSRANFGTFAPNREGASASATTPLSRPAPMSVYERHLLNLNRQVAQRDREFQEFQRDLWSAWTTKNKDAAPAAPKGGSANLSGLVLGHLRDRMLSGVSSRIPAAAASRIEGVRNSMDRGRALLDRVRSAPAAGTMGSIFSTTGATAAPTAGSRTGGPNTFQRQVAREEREHREWEKDHWEKWARRQEKPKPTKVDVKVSVKGKFGGGGGGGGDGDEYDIDIDNDKDKKKKKQNRRQGRPRAGGRGPRPPRPGLGGLGGTALGRGAGVLGVLSLGSEMIEDTFFRTPEERLKVIEDRQTAFNETNEAAESMAPDWMANAFGWGKYREQGPLGKRWVDSLWGGKNETAATAAPSMTVAPPRETPLVLGNSGPGFSLAGVAGVATAESAPSVALTSAPATPATPAPATPAPVPNADERRAQQMRDQTAGRTPISINGQHVGYMDDEGIHVENEADRALVEGAQTQLREKLGTPTNSRQIRLYGNRESGKMASDIVGNRTATAAEMSAPVGSSAFSLDGPTVGSGAGAAEAGPVAQRTIGERPAGSLAQPLGPLDGEGATLEYKADGSYTRSTPNSTRLIGNLQHSDHVESVPNLGGAGAGAGAGATVDEPVLPFAATEAGVKIETGRTQMQAGASPELAAHLGRLWSLAEAGPAAAPTLERIAPVDFGAGSPVLDAAHTIGTAAPLGRGTTTVQAEQFNIVLPDDSARTFAWALIEAIDKYFKEKDEDHGEVPAGEGSVDGKASGATGSGGAGGGTGTGSGNAGAAPGDSQSRSGAEFGGTGGNVGGGSGGGSSSGPSSSSGARLGSGGASSGEGTHGQSRSRGGGRGSPRAQQERAAARGKEDAELKGREDAATAKATGAKSRIAAADKELADVEAARAASGPMDQAGLDNRKRKAEAAKAGAQKDLEGATAEQGAVASARQETGRRRAAEDTAAAAASKSGKAAPPKPTADVSGMGDLPGVAKPLPGSEGSAAKLAESSQIKDGKGRVVSTANTAMPTEQRALLDTIAMGDATSGKNSWESPDYNTIVGGKKFDDLSKHPEVFGTAESTAAGRYQFTKSTWNGVTRNGVYHPGVVARYNKQNPDAPIKDFSPESQDKAAMFLAQEDYKRRTGRNLKEDLKSKDPAVQKQLGEMIKGGLGGQGMNTTWQIFQKKSAAEVQQAYEANLKRNEGYGTGPKMSEGVNPKAATNADLQSIDDKLKKRLEAGNLSEADRAKIEAQRAELGTHMGKLAEQEKAQAAPPPAAEGGKTNPATVAPTAGPATVGPNGRMSTPSVAEKQGGAQFRKMGIQDGLREQLQFAAEKAGVEVDVGSGGQMSLEEARSKGARQVGKNWYLPDGTPVRTGSERHDNGGAADVRLYTRDAEGKRRQLDMTNAEDQAKMHQFTKHSVAAGATGVGGGVGYMGTGTLHIGGGKEVVAWGGAEWVERARLEGVDARKSGEFKAWKEQKLAEAKAKEDAAKTGKPVAGGTAGAEKAADAGRVREVDEDFHAGHDHNHGPNGHNHGPEGHKHEPQGTASAERKAAWAGKENPFTRGRKPGEAKAADGATAAKIEPVNTGRAADAGPVDNSVPAILQPQRSAKVAAPEKATMPTAPDGGPKGEGGAEKPAAPEKAAVPAPNDSGPKNAAAEVAAAQPKEGEASKKPATAAYADGAVIHERSVIDRGAGYSAQIAERGPEAIMPLERGPDGRLGVSVASAEAGASAGATASAENDNPQAFAPRLAASGGSGFGREEDQAGASRREAYVPPAPPPAADPSRGASAAMGQPAPSMSTTGRGGNGEAPPSMTMMPSRIPDFEMQSLLTNSA